MSRGIRHRLTLGVALILGLVVLAMLGIAVSLEPLVVITPLALVLTVGLFVSPRARASFVIIGGLVVLQSSQGLSAPKVAYLAGMALCFLIALIDRTNARTIRSLLLPSALFAFAIGISFVTALSRDTSLSDWIRDAVGYGLLAASPILAFDFARSGMNFLRNLFIVAGFVATASFTAEWIARHRIGQLPFSQFTLSSYMLVAALFAYACGSALVIRRHRALWIGVAVLTAGALVLTGTRSAVFLLAAPLVIALSPGLRSPRRMLSTALSMAVVIVFVVGVFTLAGGALGANTGEAFTRVASTVSLSNSGSANTTSTNDTRIVVNKLAWHAYESSPVFGVGAGHVWTYQLPYATTAGYGVTVSTTTVDTTLAALAEFGFIGFCVLIYFMIAIGRFAWRQAPTPPVLAIIGTSGVFCMYAFTTNAFGDKGLSLALSLLLAMVVAERLKDADCYVEDDSAIEIALATKALRQRDIQPATL